MWTLYKSIPDKYILRIYSGYVYFSTKCQRYKFKVLNVLGVTGNGFLCVNERIDHQKYVLHVKVRIGINLDSVSSQYITGPLLFVSSLVGR